MHDVRVKTSSGWAVRIHARHNVIHVYREGLTKEGAPVDELVLSWASTRLKKDWAMIVAGVECNSIDVTRATLDLVPRFDKKLKSKLDRKEEERDKRSWWAGWREDTIARERELTEF